MNPTLTLLQNRRSVRAYSDQPISAEEREQILAATFRAPTAGNMMLYAIIEVTSQSLKEKLAVSCDNQPFIVQAPLVLLFLADYQRWFDFYTHCAVKARSQELGRPYRTPQAGDLLLACCDALIAAQTAVIAAESLGIGSCYIGDILEQCETHRSLFNLPPYTLPITLLCFGHPLSSQPPANFSPRFGQEYILHQNSYRRYNGPELEAMFQHLTERFLAGPKPASGAENVGQANYFRKFVADFSIEMSRSVKEYLKSWE